MSTNVSIDGDNNTVSVTNPTAHSEDATVDLVEPKFSIDGKLILPPDFFVYGKKRLPFDAARKWEKFIPSIVLGSYPQSITGLIDYVKDMYNEILDIGKTTYKK